MKRFDFSWWTGPLSWAGADSCAGAVVIAAARGERKLAHARELGADLAVDYSPDDWTDRVREATGGTGVHVVFDAAGGKAGRAAFDVTAPGGRFLSYGAASGGFAEIDPDRRDERQITVIGIYRPSPEDWRRLTRQDVSQLAAGHVRPVIGQTFRLDHVDDAHARSRPAGPSVRRSRSPEDAASTPGGGVGFSPWRRSTVPSSRR